VVTETASDSDDLDFAFCSQNLGT